MKSKALFLFIIFSVILNAQVLGPDGNYYDNNCVTDGQGTFLNVEVFFNDPNHDCISNDWIVDFTNFDGTHSYYTNEDWLNSNPSSNGFYDFNNGIYNCCDSNAGTNPNTCPCTWEYDPSTSLLMINCPDDC